MMGPVAPVFLTGPSSISIPCFKKIDSHFSSGVEQLVEGKKLKGKKDKKLVYEFVKTISLANYKKDFESE